MIENEAINQPFVPKLHDWENYDRGTRLNERACGDKVPEKFPWKNSRGRPPQG